MYGISRNEEGESIGTETVGGRFAISWGSDLAISNANKAREDLPDNKVDLLFSEFLRERIPLRIRQRG